MNMFLKLIWGWPIAIVFFVTDFVAGVIPGLLFRFLKMKNLSDSWLSLFGTLTSWVVLFLVGAKVQISGIENLNKARQMRKEGKHLCLIANHTSMLDIPLVCAVWRANCGFVLKKEIAVMPYINLRAFAMKSVFLDRKSLKSAKTAIEKAVENISDGYNLLVFPEGTRSKTGKVGTFRRGAFRFASESNSYIVPITIKGVRSLFEERKYPFMRKTCYIDFGEPVKPDYSLPREKLVEIEKAVETTIVNTYNSLN